MKLTKSKLKEIIREELLNEGSLSIGGIKFKVDVGIKGGAKGGLLLNFIPPKKYDKDPEKMWDIVGKYLNQKLKWGTYYEHKNPNHDGITLMIAQYDLEKWIMKLIK